MKQFNEEYKEFANANAPDLWDRIESQIDQKIELSSGRKKTNKRGQKKVVSLANKKREWMRLATSVAACVAALILVIPVYRMVSSSDQSEEKGEQARLVDITIENSQQLAKADETNQETDKRAQSDQVAAYEAPKFSEATEAAEEVAINVAEDVAGEEAQELFEAENESLANLVTEEETKDIQNEKEALALNLITTGAEETITITILGVLQETTENGGVTYSVEYPNVLGDGLVAYETWTMTADENISIVVGGQYQVGLTHIDRENKTAVISEVVQ